MNLSLLIPKVKVRIADSSWPQRLKTWLLYTIIFFAPTQLGLHSWPDSAFVYGVRVDYLAPTFYFLDLLILVYIFLHSLGKSFRLLPTQLEFLYPILFANLLYSGNPISTLSWSLHLILYVSFISLLSNSFKTLNTKAIINTVLLSSLFQVLLALVQIYLGHSVGGIMYYLGERTIAVGQPAVALATFMGRVVLRAYGTFSHPNILAGWLVLAYLIINQLNQKKNLIVDYCLLLITILGLLLTQSRAAALSLFGFVFPLHFLKSLRPRLIYFTFFLIVLSWTFITSDSPLSRQLDLSISERLSLQSLSLTTITYYPLFGTGAEASISTYPSLAPNFRLLQPDHNSFTLFLSWFGLFGIISTLPYFKSNYFKLNIISFVPLLPLFLLDHYLLTSPQGLFLFLLYLKVVN